MTFPTKQGEWTPRIGQLAFWQQLYPRVPVLDELGHALAWLEANPAKQKTMRGMPKFLVGWLNRASVQQYEYQRIIKFAAQLPPRRDRAVCPHQPPCASPGNWQCQQRTVLEQARAQR